MRDDFTFAMRLLRRHPTYTLACVVTLALGIGATTAVFSVIDATLLRPLPYKDPDRLVALNVLIASPGGTQAPMGPSQIELVRWQAASRSFEYLSGVEPRTMALTGAGAPEAIRGAAVSSELFPMLGGEPRLGRTFSVDAERTGVPCAVISDALWRRGYGADPSALGRAIVLDGRAFEIVGVMPAGFEPLLEPSDAWVPLRAVVNPAQQNVRVMNGAGRLRAGVSQAPAERELREIGAQLAREFPISHGHVTPFLLGLREQLFGGRRPALWALGAAVALLLGLACANVLNLTISHLATRRGELAIRAAIGGTRWHLARLQLVETGLLAATGGACGLAVMSWALPPLLALHAANGEPAPLVALDWRVAAFGALVTCGTAVLPGIVPAMRAHRASVEGGLAHGASSRVAPKDRRVRSVLVVAQVALAIVLLCGAGAFTTSLQRLLATAPGFSPDGVLSMQIRLSPLTYPDVTARATFVRQMLERVSALPGVVAAGTTQTTFLPNQSMQTGVWIEGRPIDAEHIESTHIRHSTPGYFQALRVPLVEGRALEGRDRIGTPPVCVVSARFAKRFWPNESAIGHRLRRLGTTAPWMTIVGIASDVMDIGLGVQQGPTLYVPYLQQNTPTAGVTLVVRTLGDPLAFGRDIERAIWSVDPGQPVDRIARLSDVLVDSTGDQRFRTILLGAFASAGLLLALVGIYGVTAAAVKARTWEVGVRMALGATPQRVVGEMLSESSRRIGYGTAAGVATFLAAGRLASGLLYNTSFGEPAVLVSAIAPLVAVALLVSYVQARRLASVSPVSALRGQVQ